MSLAKKDYETMRETEGKGNVCLSRERLSVATLPLRMEQTRVGEYRHTGQEVSSLLVQHKESTVANQGLGSTAFLNAGGRS
ncbi:uncharacterized protein ColSpa_11091 [Colletotrichum spaethianum]|uniref:Uncharacterized protein n=1 Tax=Colletotrichum spaethianum TaxID=700344 RepID=A0AA37UPL4_9PEZI|nr:uncharacterized protein ColSpa_11091 [Colletotrichum spaethianum]GKT50910.1 hypothetical protein ColSpa_11091 [Colletotrichum spaethianum]